MILKEEDHLEHYGILRRSGRYPWGSGEDEMSTRNRSFLDTVGALRKQGFKDTEIAEGFGMNTTQLRARQAIEINKDKLDKIGQAQRLKDKGYSNVAIAQRMGLPSESSVRALLAPGVKDRADVLTATSNMLKEQVAKKGLIDVGSGVSNQIGVTDTKLKTAVAMLQQQGYKVHYLKVQQLGTGKETTVKVLSAPNVSYSEVYRKRGEVQQIDTHTDDGGRSFPKDHEIGPPKSISSKRIAVNYAEDGGSAADGVMYVRPNVKDLNLGKSSYAQVRIAVDGTHYLKGMAVYKDDLPEGTDILFNTNKSKSTPLKSKDPKASQVLKPMDRDAEGNIDKDRPFGAQINRQSGALNIIHEEGDWDTWSKNLSSQVLSKQDPKLAQGQLAMSYERRKNEYDTISHLTNPVIKKKLLESFSDETDAAAVDLKAAALPGQATRVILPINSIKPNEIYSPAHNNGETVALIRFPHAGTFEIPILTVNNKNPEAQKILGSSAKDAVGIHHDVAQHLSGADFDGDHVLVIPNKTGAIKAEPPLEGLRGFDPQIYKIPDGSGIPKIKPSRKQQEMGKITNLIADMTIRGANSEEKARAVRHSMVVIDSEKHGLDFQRSAKDNGILQLKEKYQGGSKKGASTLITRAGSEKRINERKLRPAAEGGPIDPVTGKKIYVETGRSYVNRKGETVRNTTAVDRLAIEDDARNLLSDGTGTPVERVYADHSNKLKALANQARKDSLDIKTVPVSTSAKQTYAPQVASLVAKLNVAEKNAPRERAAQVLGQVIVSQKRQANPDMDPETLKKVRGKALIEARDRVGARKQMIEITQPEWDAIQAHAISTNQLRKIINNTDIESLKQYATPKTAKLMTTTKVSRAKQMLDSGYTQAEVARQLGVSLSTLKASID